MNEQIEMLDKIINLLKPTTKYRHKLCEEVAESRCNRYKNCTGCIIKYLNKIKEKEMEKYRLYGKIGFPSFGKRLEDEDYDVFICDIGDYKTGIDDMEDSDHYNTIDVCIMWGVLQVMDGKLHDGMRIAIQNPDTDVVKEYTTYDSLLEDLWKTLTDVPMNPDTEDMEEDWFIFPKGTNREDIWDWFDEQHPKGVGWMMENVRS